MHIHQAIKIDYKNNSSLVGIIIKEGKNHQVKRMCLNVGKTVTLLKRVRMGSLCLDPSLKEGEYRELEEEELNLLQESVK